MQRLLFLALRDHPCAFDRIAGRKAKVHLHLFEPSPETLEHIDGLRARLSNVELSWTADDCRLANGLEHRTVYYAGSRFLLAPLILEKTQSPLLCIDVDGIAMQSVWPCYELKRQAADLVLIQRPDETKPTMKVLASAVGINPTPKGIKFAGDLGRSLAAILAMKPGYHVDQIAIHYLLRELSPATAPIIAEMPKALWDHDFGSNSAIWTAKGWGRKESSDFRHAKQTVFVGNPGFHVSYSPTATEMPGWAPGSGGMTVRETHQAMEAIALSGRMTSMDISPVAAELDDRIGHETVNFVMSAFGKRIL